MQAPESTTHPEPEPRRRALLLTAMLAAALAVGGCGGKGSTPTECKANADCAAGQECRADSRTCVPCSGGVCGGSASCTSSADCAGGRVCKASACVVCAADADCGDGKRCSDGACVSSSTACAKDGDCPSGLCGKSNHQCATCRADADCGEGRTCSTGACVAKTCQAASAAADCGSRVCKDGKCAECAVDGDCGAGKACSAGACVVSGACKTSEDCEAGQVCGKDHVCGNCNAEVACSDAACWNDAKCSASEKACAGKQVGETCYAPTAQEPCAGEAKCEMDGAKLVCPAPPPANAGPEPTPCNNPVSGTGPCVSGVCTNTSNQCQPAWKVGTPCYTTPSQHDPICDPTVVCVSGNTQCPIPGIGNIEAHKEDTCRPESACAHATKCGGQATCPAAVAKPADTLCGPAPSDICHEWQQCGGNLECPTGVRNSPSGKPCDDSDNPDNKLCDAGACNDRTVDVWAEFGVERYWGQKEFGTDMQFSLNHTPSGIDRWKPTCAGSEDSCVQQVQMDNDTNTRRVFPVLLWRGVPLRDIRSSATRFNIAARYQDHQRNRYWNFILRLLAKEGQEGRNYVTAYEKDFSCSTQLTVPPQGAIFISDRHQECGSGIQVLRDDGARVDVNYFEFALFNYDGGYSYLVPLADPAQWGTVGYPTYP